MYKRQSIGISFARLHEEGVDPGVARLTMAFKTPLLSGDEFVSKLYLKKEGIKSVSYTHLDVYKRQRWYCVVPVQNVKSVKRCCSTNVHHHTLHKD